MARPDPRSSDAIDPRVTADRSMFELDDDDWRAFQTALESSPILKPRLRTLLAESPLSER